MLFSFCNKKTIKTHLVVLEQELHGDVRLVRHLTEGQQGLTTA
jgi:hypothetical protein